MLQHKRHQPWAVPHQAIRMLAQPVLSLQPHYWSPAAGCLMIHSALMNPSPGSLSYVQVSMTSASKSEVSNKNEA